MNVATYDCVYTCVCNGVCMNSCSNQELRVKGARGSLCYRNINDIDKHIVFCKWSAPTVYSIFDFCCEVWLISVQGRNPIKWEAPEVLEKELYSEKSEV